MKLTAFAAALALATTGAAQAALINIDDFSTAQGPVDAAPGTTNTDTLAAPAGAIGDRTLSATASAGSLGDTTGFITGSPTGLLGVSNDFLSQGTVTISYDLSGFDLSDGGTNDTILVGINSIDLAGLFSVTVNGVTNATGVSTMGTLNFSFADFGGVDFGNVMSLAFSVDSNGIDDLDSSFSFIGVDDLEPNPSVNPVPLPAGGVLLLTGLLGLAYTKRRKA